jgi:hypothetical protein
MKNRIFPGYPAYLETAADRLGCPAAPGPAGRIVPVTALANLCAQATASDPVQVDAIRGPAHALYDQLRVASLAARLMLADLEALSKSTEPVKRPASNSKARASRGPSTP